MRVGKDQFCWQVATMKKFLLTVDISQDCLKQPCPLNDSGFDGLPFSGGKRQRQQVEWPGRASIAGVGKGIECGSVLTAHPVCPALLLLQPFMPICIQGANERPPMLAGSVRCVEKLIVAASVWGDGSEN